MKRSVLWMSLAIMLTAGAAFGADELRLFNQAVIECTVVKIDETYIYYTVPDEEEEKKIKIKFVRELVYEDGTVLTSTEMRTKQIDEEALKQQHAEIEKQMKKENRIDNILSIVLLAVSTVLFIIAYGLLM